MPRIVDDMLECVQRLLHIFRFERFLYLLGGSISFLVGIYAAVAVIRSGGAESANNTFRMIASSGGFAFTAGGFLFVFNKVFNLFKQMFEAEIKKDHGQRPGQETR